MKVLVDISKDVYQNMMGNDLFKSANETICYKAVLNGTPISNATNGDVMKAIFNCKTSNEDSNYLVKYSLDGIYEEVSSDWWNAPYQKGGKE